MKINLPEDRLFELGFEVLNYIYGELEIKRGRSFHEVFVNKHNESRLAYSKMGREEGWFLCFLYDDMSFFLGAIPVERDDFERVLKFWFESTYNRQVKAMEVRRGLSHIG